MLYHDKAVNNWLLLGESDLPIVLSEALQYRVRGPHAKTVIEKMILYIMDIIESKDTSESWPISFQSWKKCPRWMSVARQLYNNFEHWNSFIQKYSSHISDDFLIIPDKSINWNKNHIFEIQPEDNTNRIVIASGSFVEIHIWHAAFLEQVGKYVHNQWEWCILYVTKDPEEMVFTNKQYLEWEEPADSSYVLDQLATCLSRIANIPEDNYSAYQYTLDWYTEKEQKRITQIFSNFFNNKGKMQQLTDHLSVSNTKFNKMPSFKQLANKFSLMHFYNITRFCEHIPTEKRKQTTLERIISHWDTKYLSHVTFLYAVLADYFWFNNYDIKVTKDPHILDSFHQKRTIAWESR